MADKSFKNDILFRHLFSADHNKNVLISLLNPLIDLIGLSEITDITVLNPFLGINSIDDKKSVVDIRAVDNEGKFYNIEMQVGRDADYKNRAINYLTKMHSSQLKKGRSHSETKTSIGIHLLDFVLYPKDKIFYTTVGLTELNKSCRLHSDDLYLIYIELPKINYKEGDFTTLKKWFYFIENVYKKEDPVIKTLRKEMPEIDQAALEYERFIADQTIQYAIQAREMAESDYTSGMERAKAEGLAEGKAEIAKNLKAKKFTTSEIAEITGLSIIEIEKL